MKMENRQTTLTKEISLEGVGLHSGRFITIRLIPALDNQGIVFVRSDLIKGDNIIPARWDHVIDTRLCTVIGNNSGASIGTIEHLMAALRGCGIDNLTIEIDGPEVPAMDGSAMPFVIAIEKAGIKELSLSKKAIKVLREISVEQDFKRVTLKPSDDFVFSGEIEFDHVDIGRQQYKTHLVNGNFKHDIAQARTFGFLHEVEYMRSQGLALGGSMDNAIVLGKDAVLNPDGLRFSNEFIRHKILDAIGDLYLAGSPILGEYDGLKAGHAMNNALLHAMFASSDNWTYVDLEKYSGNNIKGGRENLSRIMSMRAA